MLRGRRPSLVPCTPRRGDRRPDPRGAVPGRRRRSSPTSTACSGETAGAPAEVNVYMADDQQDTAGQRISAPIPAGSHSDWLLLGFGVARPVLVTRDHADAAGRCSTCCWRSTSALQCSCSMLTMNAQRRRRSCRPSRRILLFSHAVPARPQRGEHAPDPDGRRKPGASSAAFGKYVGGNNLGVGLVVFLILIIIQFVVITKGSGRISEVAARFVLDAMPGKQMAIDADLNGGLIDAEEAKSTAPNGQPRRRSSTARWTAPRSSCAATRSRG